MPTTTVTGLAADAAARAIAAVWPQAIPRAWRGSPGADTETVDGHGRRIVITLRKDDKFIWWAEATTVGLNATLTDFASTAAEAARKLHKSLREQ